MERDGEGKGLKRREFFKVTATALAGTALAGGRTGAVEASRTWMEEEWAQANVPQRHLAMLIDLRKCVGCNSCTVSCIAENNVPVGVFRSWVDDVEHDSYPNVRRYFLPRLCNHCDDPPCTKVCPVEAPFKRPDGIVVIDYDKCVGYKYCIQACPYDAIFWNLERPSSEKCTFCAHRIDAGLEPACVTTCIGEARVFGDLDDPRSEISRLLAELVPRGLVYRLKPGLGTGPNIYYVLPQELAGPERLTLWETELGRSS